MFRIALLLSILGLLALLSTPGLGTMPKHLRFATPGRRQASGPVECAPYGKSGEINGAMLNDGAIVRFPQFAAQLRSGQTFAAEGLGIRNEYGRAIEAISIGATPQTLQPVYDRPIGRAP
jgi:hypothetical protein